MNTWKNIAHFILKNRLPLLIVLGLSTLVMGYFAAQVQLTNEFNRSIPKDNPKFIDYLKFKDKFGEDGNVLVIGFNSSKLFEKNFFNAYQTWSDSLKKSPYVEDVLSVGKSLNVTLDTAAFKYVLNPIFPAQISSQSELDSCAKIFNNLPFYKDRIYVPSTQATLLAVRINKGIMNTPKRMEVVTHLTALSDSFARQQNVALHYSGLPYIRTLLAKKLAHEGTLFTILSLVLTAIILLLFFRSWSAVLFSLVVVFIGVIFTLATIVLFGFKVTLLTALAPTLIVVIGIPNCVYLLNKYHLELGKDFTKIEALQNVIEKMGVVTLFTNLTAAIGFGVFIFTKSALLYEFGVVAGINIIVIFLVSLIFIPCIYSYLPLPLAKHTDYLDNKWLTAILDKLEYWVLHHRRTVYAFSLVFLIVGTIGIFRLKSLAFIVDDLPKKDPIALDLNYFETNFHGIMPFEIIIDTKKKNKAVQPTVFRKLDELETVLAKYPEFSKPLSLAQGIKFATQAYYQGDSNQFRIPEGIEQAFVYDPLLKKKSKNNPLLSAFIDSTNQTTRVSVSMRDIGSNRLPQMVDSLTPQIYAIFDTSKYHVTITGASVIFLEGSRFIVNGLRDSLIFAFLTIIICMLWLFRSWKILLISLLPNVLPLIITAGIMGWMGISLKPSTVLIFSISLGIAIDVTIRFLVNFKQELLTHNNDIELTVRKTVQETGVSIIYTSLVLFAGFFIFAISDFGGTVALGLLTSLTLVFSMITNLTLLPSFLLWMGKSSKK
jgi:predicted RND superfamily exporter protein